MKFSVIFAIILLASLTILSQAYSVQNQYQEMEKK